MDYKFYFHFAHFISDSVETGWAMFNSNLHLDITTAILVNTQQRDVIIIMIVITDEVRNYRRKL